MAGLYLHIPFCESRCIYCGFYSTTMQGIKADYVDALCHELTLRGEELPCPIHTIYIGGGTPSCLSLALVKQLLTVVRRVAPEAKEMTMEMNPDDVEDSYIEGIRALGVNRVSMGVQTFDNERLRWMGRRHTAEEAIGAVERLRKHGMDNVSIDLIYGFPGQRVDDWEEDLNKALMLDVEHLSAYALSIEEGTPLHRMWTEGRLEETDEEVSIKMFERLITRMEEAGYEHYEISNFAKKGRRSRHNSSYWTGEPYIGLGAAAHSYDGKRSRKWNVSDVRSYITEIAQDRLPSEGEWLTDVQLFNERLMLSLRTKEGVDKGALMALGGEERYERCRRKVEQLMTKGLLTEDDTAWRLTKEAIFVSDMIIEQLFEED